MADPNDIVPVVANPQPLPGYGCGEGLARLQQAQAELNAAYREGLPGPPDGLPYTPPEGELPRRPLPTPVYFGPRTLP